MALWCDGGSAMTPLSTDCLLSTRPTTNRLRVAAVVLSVPVLCSVTQFATQSKEKEIADSVKSAERREFPKALAVITAAGLFGPAASLLAVVGAPANSVILSTATATACVVAIFKFSTLQGDPDYYV